MKAAIINPGDRYGHLTVIKEVGRSPSNKRRFLCKCDCGNELEVIMSSFTTGHTTSCGCEHRRIVTKHNLSYKRIYQIWNGMVYRCSEKERPAKVWKKYGARGIRVCEEWKNFMNFYNWAINNGYKENLTIDRIDSDKGYYPENCQWADYKTQNTHLKSKHDCVGVYYNKGHWYSYITVNYRQIYFGKFNTQKEAADARNAYIDEHHLPNKKSKCDVDVDKLLKAINILRNSGAIIGVYETVGKKRYIETGDSEVGICKADYDILKEVFL